MDLWIATTNQGKLNEFRNILQSTGATIHSVSEIKNYSSPPENGATFIENARIKARSLKAMRPGEWVIADDSGLEAEGLNNLPGIHSARYAGPKARDGENVAKLLKMLSLRTTNRKARFVCAMVVFDPQGVEHVFEGTVEGTISDKVRGTTGFGYDPVFIPNGETQTFAELGAAVKNKLSHRANAIRKLTEILK